MTVCVCVGGVEPCDCVCVCWGGDHVTVCVCVGGGGPCDCVCVCWGGKEEIHLGTCILK